MAHFAKLDENNVVLEVHVVSNNVINDLPFPKSEPLGVAFLVMWSNGHPYWKQTSYNRKFRKHFAGIGFIYDETYDAFIPPKPEEDSILNLDTFLWETPVKETTDISSQSYSALTSQSIGAL
jgi:hypothetical protein